MSKNEQDLPQLIEKVASKLEKSSMTADSIQAIRVGNTVEISSPQNFGELFADELGGLKAGAETSIVILHRARGDWFHTFSRNLISVGEDYENPTLLTAILKRLLGESGHKQ